MSQEMPDPGMSGPVENLPNGTAISGHGKCLFGMTLHNQMKQANPTDHFSNFSLGQRVRLAESGEEGTIIRVFFALDTETAYFVRYKAADGRQVEQWWGESAIGYADL